MIFTALLLAGALSAGEAGACGWWGERGDMLAEEKGVLVGAEGKALDAPRPESRDLRIPGRQGFGLAVRRADRALPYRQVADGADITSLAGLGFVAVIDLGTPAAEARRHGGESKAAGMRYFNLPGPATPPDPVQIRRFSRLIEAAANRPLLIYAASADQLAVMWTLHQVQRGVGRATAMAEGRGFGLTWQSENELHWHLRHGSLKTLPAPG